MNIQEQYERFPYPPLPRFALPRFNEGGALRYELGIRLTSQKIRSHRGIRILVAGAGTFEALVVAQNHPGASEIVAVDRSARSLSHLRQRVLLYRTARFYRRLPPLRTVCADLQEWKGAGKFDFILASNVLHHVEEPGELLNRLSAFLLPEGILRIVTYPKASRIWMRATSRYLRSRNLSPDTPRLLAKANQMIRELPASSPIRSCFESQPEIKTRTGLVDAFFNACENPLSPHEWKSACQKAGLRLAAEGQTETSRSSFLDLLIPGARAFDTWSKLQVLDDLLELCANPVLWLSRTDGATRPTTPVPEEIRLSDSSVPESEIAAGLKRVEHALKPLGVSLSDVRKALQEKVGPRISPPPGERILPGLSLLDYDWNELLSR